jgi:hypothetical protein
MSETAYSSSCSSQIPPASAYNASSYPHDQTHGWGAASPYYPSPLPMAYHPSYAPHPPYYPAPYHYPQPYPQNGEN